jgi:hypothetical protein
MLVHLLGGTNGGRIPSAASQRWRKLIYQPMISRGTLVRLASGRRPIDKSTTIWLRYFLERLAAIKRVRLPVLSLPQNGMRFPQFFVFQTTTGEKSASGSETWSSIDCKGKGSPVGDPFGETDCLINRPRLPSDGSGRRSRAGRYQATRSHRVPELRSEKHRGSQRRC